MIDLGSGTPLVLIPGIQGRWEWMQPAVEELSKSCRVISSSLPGERGANPDSNGSFDLYTSHVDALLDRAGVQSAVICGVSFGGYVALRYAARRKERVGGLILVSVPGPRWKPAPHLARYMRFPTLASPLFFAGAVRRFLMELRATIPGPVQQATFCLRAVPRILSAPAIPSRMSHRAQLAAAEDFESDCAAITAPTLVIAGERDLDQVVRHQDTIRYASLIRGARFRLFERTGHLGLVMAPERFAKLITDFLADV